MTEVRFDQLQFEAAWFSSAATTGGLTVLFAAHYPVGWAGTWSAVGVALVGIFLTRLMLYDPTRGEER